MSLYENYKGDVEFAVQRLCDECTLEELEDFKECLSYFEGDIDSAIFRRTHK